MHDSNLHWSRVSLQPATRIQRVITQGTISILISIALDVMQQNIGAKREKNNCKKEW